ncbi:hypothetical protein LGW64_02795, partial [Streptococcus mutans]|nr:hypothetical protein [Streptococcus mutans]
EESIPFPIESNLSLTIFAAGKITSALESEDTLESSALESKFSTHTINTLLIIFRRNKNES